MNGNLPGTNSLLTEQFTLCFIKSILWSWNILQVFGILLCNHNSSKSAWMYNVLHINVTLLLPSSIGTTTCCIWSQFKIITRLRIVLNYLRTIFKWTTLDFFTVPSESIDTPWCFHILLQHEFKMDYIYILSPSLTKYPIITKWEHVFRNFHKLMKNEKLKCFASINIQPFCDNTPNWTQVHPLSFDHPWNVSTTLSESTCVQFNWLDMI